MKNFWNNINLVGIRAVLLDLDDTIYRYQICHEYALKDCYLEFKKKEKNFQFEIFKKKYKQAQESVKKHLINQGSGHSRLLYFQFFFEKFYGQTGIKMSQKFEDLYWKSFFKKMVLVPGVESFLKKCNTLGIKVCIVSDLTAKIQFEKICFLKLEKYVDFVVTSEEAGVEKPSRQIFDLALKKLNLNKDDVLMVGDHSVKDIEGAKSFGIKNVYQILV